MYIDRLVVILYKWRSYNVIDAVRLERRLDINWDLIMFMMSIVLLYIFNLSLKLFTSLVQNIFFNFVLFFLGFQRLLIKILHLLNLFFIEALNLS